MMIKPKRIGDDLTLDEYNACQFLLYQLTCWNEVVLLNTATAQEGTYGTYKLQRKSQILNEKQSTYRLIEDMNSSNAWLDLETVTTNKNLTNSHIQPEVTIFYKLPKTMKDGTNTEQKYDAIQEGDIVKWKVGEAKKEPSIKDFTKATVPTTKNGKMIRFELKDKDGNILPKDTVIAKVVYIRHLFNKEPHIDFRNGEANDMSEIWVDNQEDLQKLIEHAPRDGTLTIIRLDSNIKPTVPKNAQHSSVFGTYYLSKTIIINEGQNIEIRGGTNNNAILNASISRRCFLINPGGKLSLNHITCEYGNSGKAYYNKGRGGAILVENEKKKYGILECENCTFQHNTSWYGGAIFAYHTGLHLNKCTFVSNTAGFLGGAIEYAAQNVEITFKNIVATLGSKVTLVAKVVDMNKQPKNEGEVWYYIRKDGEDTYIGRSRVRATGTDAGTAPLEGFEVPESKQTTEYTLIAKYTGGRAVDNDVAMATLTVKVPEEYKVSWEKGNVVTGKVGDTISLNAKVVDNQGVLTTDPQCQYTVNGKTMIASMNGSTYQLKYQLTEEDIINDKTEFLASFSVIPSDFYVSNVITAKITVEVEKTSNEVSGYITGLFVNGGTTITTSLIESWETAGITDVYIRFNDYSSSTGNTLITQATTELAKLNKTREENKKDKVKTRFHVAMNCFYDAGNKKWISPTDSSRMTFLKAHIDYITKTYKDISGICLDYVRYPGTTQNSSAHTTITNKLKELNEHIKKQNKNYIISASVMPEDDGSSLYYGQNFKEMSEYIDYLQIMAYKGDYSVGGKEQDDDWVKARIQYAINKEIDVNKIVASLQTYNSDTDTSSRSKTNLETTEKALKELKIKGVSFFREGLIVKKDGKTDYPSSYAKIVEGK